MNQVNATIRIDTRRLNIPLLTIHPCLGHSFVAEIIGAPADVLGLFVRIYKPDGSYFDIPGNERPNGEYLVYIIGTCFPVKGDAVYEVHALDARGNATALGRGNCVIGPFSVTTTPITPGAAVSVAQVPTADGSLVQIQMVQDELGEWVYQAVTQNGDAE